MDKVTEFGFNIGSMEVTRVYHDKSKSNNVGVAAISVKTNKTSFSVRATKTGFIRIFDEQGNECEIVNKEYINSLVADQIKYNKG